ncbi:MAG: protein phosphatase 2C domain-containing protein [Propionibacteriaceae bacterium]|nr:protein phosphatase 2C domain-containing protein [Propionibacteriaceae bacterium]
MTSPTAGSGLTSLIAASVSHPGLHRPVNEDSVVAEAPIFLVADGMGGHQAGDRASAIVVDEFSELVGREAAGIDEVRATLARARERINALSRSNPARPAGTTVSGAVLVSQNGDPYWLIVNIGDSRTYRLSEGRLERLTVDHSEVQELIDAGELTTEEARSYPRRNIVTRALGADMIEHPDYWFLPIEDSDRLLVCSDGLSGEVPDDVIEETLLEYPDPDDAVKVLLDLALGAGGWDNVSIIVVDASVETNDVSTLGESLSSSGNSDNEDTEPRLDLPTFPVFPSTDATAGDPLAEVGAAVLNDDDAVEEMNTDQGEEYVADTDDVIADNAGEMIRVVPWEVGPTLEEER